MVQIMTSSVKENAKAPPVSVKSNKENCQKLKQSSKSSILKSVLPIEIFSQQELLTTNQHHLDDENISVLAKYEAIWENQSNQSNNYTSTEPSLIARAQSEETRVVVLDTKAMTENDIFERVFSMSEPNSSVEVEPTKTKTERLNLLDLTE